MGQIRNPVKIRLRQIRTAAGYSQKQLGMEAGIDEFSASARMNQYETGKHVPDFLTLKRIAMVLNVPVAYFYCEDDRLAELVSQWDTLSGPAKNKVKAFLGIDGRRE